MIFGGVDDIPNSLSFAVVQGNNPPDQTIQITNSGTCDLDYTLTATTSEAWSWLSATPTSGTVAAAGSTTLTVDVEAITTNLQPGGYTGTLTIAATCQDTGGPAVGSPANVSINLSVTANYSILDVSDDDIEFDVPSLASASWTTMSTTGAPGNRQLPAGAWSGTEFFVAGGALSMAATPPVSDRVSAYNPYADTWRDVATLPTPSQLGMGVWSDERMVVMGSVDAQGLGQAAFAYNPQTNSWATGPATTVRKWQFCTVTDGQTVWLWGGYDNNSVRVTSNVGFAYDPSTNTATALSSTSQPTNDSDAFCALTGTEFLVVTNDQFGRYDLATDTWTTTALPSGIIGESCTWTGKELVIVDGVNDEIYTWTQATNQWATPATFTDTSDVGNYSGHPVLWTGRVAVFVGFGNVVQYAAFDPETNTVTGLGSDLVGPGRKYSQTEVWTGDRLLVYGGALEGPSTDEPAPGGGALQ